MNIYTYIALAIIALIFIWRIKAGFKKGLVSELNTVLSVLGAVLLGYLIKLKMGSAMKEGLGVTISLVLLICIVLLAIKILKAIITALKLFTWLPIIKGINRLLGAVAGIIEAFVMVLYLVSLIKEWLLI